MPRVTKNPVKPAIEKTALRFVGRVNQVAQFRDSVRYMLGTQQKPADRHFAHVFIACGEGGMGKSTLLRRWCEVAQQEGIPSERVIQAQLDGGNYSSVETFADKIQQTIAANFPDFAQQYQMARRKRAELRDRYDELHEEWQRYTALRDTGKLNEIKRATQRTLAITETQRAQHGILETAPMVHQAEDSMSRLRSIERFSSAKRSQPSDFDEILINEFGDDAVVFLGGDRWSATVLGADLCALAERDEHSTLVLAIDTYELADQHDDWLREVLLEAGDRVLTVIGGRNAIHKRDGFVREFSDDLQTYVQAFDLGTLNTAELGELLGMIIEREPSDEETAEVERISRGVPLAVELLANEIKQHPQNLSHYRDLQTNTLKRKEIIHAVVTRFLWYISEQQDDDPETAQRKQQERLWIQALALPLDCDEELMAALWEVDDATAMTINRRLRAAHSFVFAGDYDYRMHDLVHEFTRADLWQREPAGWAQIIRGLVRATELLQTRLQRWHNDTAETCYDDPTWRNTVINLLNCWLWRKEYAQARQLLLNSWIGACYYHRPMAREIEHLIRELTPPTKAWRTLADIIAPKTSNTDRRDYAALKPYFEQFQPHTQVLWFMLQGQQVEPESLWLENEDGVKAVEQSIALHKKAFELDSTWQPLREK